ncbi:MAG: hypothetical protein ACRDZQ_13005, partial [Acidimicrobiales bacterium]
MGRLEGLAGELQSRLEEKAREGRVPGAGLAVSDGTGILEAATGVLNLDTRVEATTDSVFQSPAAPAGEDEAARAGRGRAPVVVERLDAKADGARLLRGVRRQLFVAEVAEVAEVAAGAA